ncbi:IS1 family transposase, partial [Escherichia coli]
CSHCRKTWQLQFTYTASQPGTHQKIIDMAMNGVGCRATARISWPQHDFTSLKKLRPQSVTSRIQPGSDVIVCAEMDEQWGYVGAKSRQREMDEQWGYVGAKSRQRWLFYAYDRLRKTVVAHVFGERTLATLERLLSLLSAFEVVVWMTDGWPLYESRLKGKLHVISKRYTQRIERHNLNLRQHLARLGRKSLSFSKSVELHDKVIGHYLNIKHYQ